MTGALLLESHHQPFLSFGYFGDSLTLCPGQPGRQSSYFMLPVVLGWQACASRPPFFCWDGVSQTFFLGWPRATILPQLSLSCRLLMTGLLHYTQILVEMGVSLTFCLGRPQTTALLISDSQVSESPVPGSNDKLLQQTLIPFFSNYPNCNLKINNYWTECLMSVFYRERKADCMSCPSLYCHHLAAMSQTCISRPAPKCTSLWGHQISTDHRQGAQLFVQEGGHTLPESPTEWKVHLLEYICKGTYIYKAHIFWNLSTVTEGLGCGLW
jgi:hypothetical protein